ncbi:MAG: 3-oxoadipate enol-lactonase [Burkholderiales bacterium]|jgi:3-oxoadipate enol-lactonase|nr:3-oxoadipate enol-lactonase [Burkholderiales bacterium]
MKIETNGVQLHCAIEGEGPWLAMSHSLACNLSMWDNEARALSKRFKVLRFDTRGHGQSGAPAGPYSLEMLADDVKGLFDALDIRAAHWVGLSMGGMIGQTFALRYPGVLRSLVLADTTSRYPKDAGPIWQDRIRLVESQGMEPLVAPTLERWFTEPFRKAHPERVAPIATAIRATPVAGYVGCSHAIPKIDLTTRLKEIGVPTLVIVGEDDPGTPVAMAREIHDALPGSELVVIPRAAHLANVEQPEAFGAALDRFYARIVD